MNTEQTKATEECWCKSTDRQCHACSLLADIASSQAPAAGVGMTDEQIVEVWNSMPGGPDGWLKNFGFIQFARALLAAQAGGGNHG